jgi:ATP-binding cassette subfamily B protein
MLTEPLQEELRALLTKHVIFSILDPNEIDQLLKKFDLVSVGLGETFITEGESGDCAYLVYSGKVRVFKQGPAGKPVTLGTLGPGELVGEVAILKNVVRTASCRASEDTALFRITRDDFETLVHHNPGLLPYFEKIIEQNTLLRFLRLATFLGALPAKQVIALLDQLEEVSYKAGETIIREGELGDRLFILRSGEVKVTVQRGGQEVVLKHLAEGAYFGERALILNQPRSANVIAVTDTSCFSLSRENFDKLMSSAPQLREQLIRGIEQYHLGEEMERKFGVRPPEGGRRPPAPLPGPDQQGPAANGRAAGVRKRRRLFKRYPWLPQHDETDCGAASLAMIARYYGMPLSVGRLRETANVGREGGSMFSLARAAEAVGFNARAIKTDFGHLPSLPLPAVAHWKGYHYLVLYEVAGDKVVLGDPAIGLLKMGRAEFEQGWTGRLLLLTPTPRLQENEPEQTTFRRFLPFLAPFKGLLFEIVLASLILQLLQLAAPVFTQMIVDKVLVHQNLHMLNIMLGGMLLIGAFQIATTLLRYYLLIHVWQKLSLTLTADLFRQILRLPMRYFHSRKLGDFLTRFEDNHRIQRLMTGRAITTLLDLLMIVTGLSLMLYYNVRLTLVALAAIPFYVVVTVLITPVLKRNNQKTFEKQANAESTLVEAVKSVAAIKDATAEVSTRWKYENHVVQRANMEFHGHRLSVALDGLSRTISILAGTFMLWYGARLVIQRELTVGQLMAFQALVGMVTTPILGLVGLWHELQDAVLSLQRLNDLYEAPAEQDAAGPALTLPRLRGHLRVEDLSFRYDEDGKNILSHINLEAEPGQTVALVGRSGSGKTTLALLLQRFYLPTEGKILLDGFDLRLADVRSLRSQLGVVAQESTIFTGTIRENIALSDPESPLERVIAAAKLANAHDFIMGFPLGYDTVVGEMGISLSGGQRQRVCIARALLKDPRLIIFDEATSALDAESEKAIQENMRVILRDRTALIIAHRISTIQNADLIVVLDEGQVVEKGTHRELLEKKGLYYYLTSQQLSL